MSYVKEALKILLGSLYFAKLSFSEVDDYFLFFCIQPLRLPGAVPNRRYRLKIYCKEFLRLLFWQRLRLLDWWKSQGVGTNTIGRLHKVMPKNVYAVAIWLTGLIFVELPACGVYTFWYIGLWGYEAGKTANMNGLWIDRWYMRQDWIRPVLAAAAITSLFYAENCKKIKPSSLLSIDGQSI